MKKQDIWFIEETDGGMIAHSRKAAHQWLDLFLDNLKDGDGDDEFKEQVRFEYRSMTDEELKLREIN